MSLPLVPVDAFTVDWKLVASAMAVFVATGITTVWGWMQGRRRTRETVSPSAEFHVSGAVIQDNTSLRDNTAATRELRDQMLLLVHVLERHVKVQDDMQDTLDSLMRRLDRTS